jgi:hypothetical protein
MSEQPPPIPFPLNPIFNYSNWITATDGTLSIAQGDARYLLKSGDNATGLIGFNAGITSLFATISQNLNFGNSNVYIRNDGSDNLVIAVPTLSKNIQFQAPAGSSRLTVRSTSVLVNGIPLYLNSTNNIGFDTFIGGTNSLTITANDASGSVRFSVANGSGVTSIPLVVNSASTTISNPTSISSLTTTTQPNGTSNTSAATTAFVQNAISLIPSSISYMPYFYGETANYATASPALSQFGFNISNAGSWGQNAYFTVRATMEHSFVQGANAPFTYFQSWSFLMDIYPSRLVTITTPNIYLLNGTINGNPNYNYNDATYAPTNRAYWTRNYVNSSALPPSGNTAIPIYITQTAPPSAQLIYNFLPPLTANPCVWRFSATCEIINTGNIGSGSAITSYNVGPAFVGGGSYTTF